jgi:hypothetical protein
MRFKRAATTVVALLVIGASGAAEPARAASPPLPVQLPAVTVVRMPVFAPSADPSARLRQRLAGATGPRRNAGGETQLQIDPAKLAAAREALMRARAEQSARTRALHGPGEDATPRVPLDR